jgi:2'-hydroxyisoflavone reductase
MKVLVLGGTVFVGRHIVEAALARGHEVTLFNRGRTNPRLFEGVEQLRGDRERGDLGALEGRSWDAVVDTSGYVPRVVRTSAELLAGSTEHYTFVSTGSVYADYSRPEIDEDSPVATVDDETTEDVGRHYGAL